MAPPPAHHLAVLIPCYNEELTVANVVRQFQAELPEAHIYVFDNNSSDRTVEEAKAAGAHVFAERRQGKGYVVQAMFRKVDAEVYIMVDGDGTYPAQAVRTLIEPIVRGEADMVIGSRLHQHSSSEFRPLNLLGNHIYRGLLNFMFGVQLTDLLSGYRAFNRRLVRGIPLFGGGFETEAEMTIKALERGFVIEEVPVDLVPRPEGSQSKIRLMRDGFIILNVILTLFRDYKPLTFFGLLGLVLFGLGVTIGISVMVEYLDTGFVAHMPAALAALGLLLTGMLAISVGLVLHTIARRFQELDYQLRLFADELRQGEARGD